MRNTETEKEFPGLRETEEEMEMEMEEEGQANRLAAAQQKQKKHTTSWDKLTENGKGKEGKGTGNDRIC